MTTTALPPLDDFHLDLRQVDCSDKRGLILGRWRSLAPGQHFVLVNHHDPIPMYHMLAGQFPGQVNWEYAERTPAYVAIRITKVGPGVPHQPFVPPVNASTACDHGAPDTAPAVIDAGGIGRSK
jgi:uncharacterized protein (DUF2249 family)